MARRSLRSGLAALVGGLAALARAGQHEVRFDRPLKVGDKIRVVASAERKRTTTETTDGGAPKTSVSNLQARVDAVMEVLAVDPHGRATRATYRIRSLTGRGAAGPVFAGGWIISAETKDNRTVLTRKGGKLTPQAEKLLAAALGPQGPAHPSDAAYGTANRKAAGDRWPVNKAGLATQMAAHGLKTDAGDVTGEVRLVGERDTGGVRCLRLEAAADVGRLMPPLPPGAVLLKSSLRVAAAVHAPLDLSLPRAREEIQRSTATQFRTAAEGGRQTLVDVAESEQLTRTYALVERPADERVTFEGEKVAVDLGEPSDHFVAGGGGRYLVFVLKDSKQVAIVDLFKGRVVKRLPATGSAPLVAASLERLVIVLPEQGVMQRWSLKTLEKERTARLPAAGTVGKALMGCNSSGPLLVASRDIAALFDVQTMAPMRVTGKMFGGWGRYGCGLWGSADGATYTSIVLGIGPVAYSRMRIVGARTDIQKFGGTSNANRWARPSADGRLLFLPGALLTWDFRKVEAPHLAGATCCPTVDPAFFLAARLARQGRKGPTRTQVGICTSVDRRTVHTLTTLDEMTFRGNTNERGAIARRLAYGEPHFHYVPRRNLFASLHWDKRRLAIRRFDLMMALEQKGGDYLFVASSPPLSVRRGHPFRYAIDARSKAGGVRYRLVGGHKTMKLSPSGLLEWRPSRYFKDKSAHAAIELSDDSGQSIAIAFDVEVVDPRAGRPTRAPRQP